GKRLRHIEIMDDLATVTFEDNMKETGTSFVRCEDAHPPTREFLVGRERAELTPSLCVVSIASTKLSR
ncbi:hypothetical protein BGZ60DRAFT_392364, partial [Tricladium varicosporioides]